MKTDHTAEDTTPDSISPEDALTLALSSRSFAEHVLRKAIQGEARSPAGGSMHPEARRRHNAKAIRENRVKADEITDKARSDTNPSRQHRPPTSYKPLWNADQLRLKLQQYDRTPFLDLLAIWMECAPTPQRVMEFADRYPDRWTKALVDLGRLGGFAEKKDIDFNFSAKVQRMSDSQLEDALRETAYRLGIPLPALLQMVATGGGHADPRHPDAIEAEVVPDQRQGE